MPQVGRANSNKRKGPALRKTHKTGHPPGKKPRPAAGARPGLGAKGERRGVQFPSYRPKRSSSFSQKVSSLAGACWAPAAASGWMGSVCRANCRADTVFWPEVKEAGALGADRVSSRLPSSVQLVGPGHQHQGGGAELLGAGQDLVDALGVGVDAGVEEPVLGGQGGDGVREQGHILQHPVQDAGHGLDAAVKGGIALPHGSGALAQGADALAAAGRSG